MDNGFDDAGIAPVEEELIVPEKKAEKPKFVPQFSEGKCSLTMVTTDEFKEILLKNQDEMREDIEETEDDETNGVVEEVERCEIVTKTSANPTNILREVVEELIVPIKVQRRSETPNLQNDESPSKDVPVLEEETIVEEQQTQTFASPQKSTDELNDSPSSQKSPKHKNLNLPNFSNIFKKKSHHSKSSSEKLDESKESETPVSTTKDESAKKSHKPSFFQRMSFGKGKKTKKGNDQINIQNGNFTDPAEEAAVDNKTGEHASEADKVDKVEKQADKNEWSNMTAHYAVGQYLDPCEIKPNLTQNSVVVAIDFGTAFSGYAYSFLNDPNQTIHMMGKWENGDPGVINQKTPTTLLLTPKGEFNSFGFTARNNYQDLSPEEATEWMLFDHFKMSLYKANSCNMNTTIEAVNGKKFSAFQAISMTLTFFKEHAIRELSVQTGSQLENEDILWVLTVPAIWSSPAKQFMRLAAYQAGMASPSRANKLIVALEPEAAAIHICRLRKHQLVSDRPVLFDFHKFKVSREPVVEHKLIEEFKKKCRYIILDCGGGTVDITVHEMDSETGLIHELQAASGGPYGASNIDLEFRLLLCKIFGKEFIESFQLNCPNGWISLMMFFESRKRAADPLKPSSLNVAFPFSFLEHFRKTQGSTVEQAIKDYGDSQIQWSPQGMLKLSQQSMQKLFQPCTEKIGECIANIIKNVEGIQYVFMVGGLSESPVLQHEIRSLCSDLCGPSVKVIIPQEASLAVVKGAVSFGLYPEILTARRSRMTYGAAVLNIYDPSKHPQAKMVKKEDKTWCKDVFDVFVRAEELINCGHVVERSYVTADPKQTKMFVGIYCSANQHPAYVTDSDVTKCANICLDLKPPSEEINQRFIRVRMEFAATEIKVTAVDASSGQHVDSSIDFLNF